MSGGCSLSERRIEVTVEFGDKRVTLTGPEDFVRDEVRRLVGAPGSTAQGGGSTHDTEEPLRPRSERDLITEKRPSGHAETIAVLAHSLRSQGQEEFTPEDIRRAYIRANVRTPKVIEQALRDARNKHDFVQSGSKRGSFRLSTHGERTVLFDLPRSDEGK
jgi:hypothetical protein